jgi:hypothetical protein
VIFNYNLDHFSGSVGSIIEVLNASGADVFVVHFYLVIL